MSRCSHRLSSSCCFGSPRHPQVADGGIVALVVCFRCRVRTSGVSIEQIDGVSLG